MQDPLLHSAKHDSTVEEFKCGNPLEVPLVEVAFDDSDGPADGGIFDQQAAVALWTKNELIVAMEAIGWVLKILNFKLILILHERVYKFCSNFLCTKLNQSIDNVTKS